MTIDEMLNVLANNTNIDITKNYGSPISGYTFKQQLDIIYNSIANGDGSGGGGSTPTPTPTSNNVPLVFYGAYKDANGVDGSKLPIFENIPRVNDVIKCDDMFRNCVFTKPVTNIDKWKFNGITSISNFMRDCVGMNELNLAKSDIFKNIRSPQDYLGMWQPTIPTIILPETVHIKAIGSSLFDSLFRYATTTKVVLPTSYTREDSVIKANVMNVQNLFRNSSVTTIENLDKLLEVVSPTSYPMFGENPSLVIESITVSVPMTSQNYLFRDATPTVNNMTITDGAIPNGATVNGILKGGTTSYPMTSIKGITFQVTDKSLYSGKTFALNKYDGVTDGAKIKAMFESESNFNGLAFTMLQTQVDVVPDIETLKSQHNFTYSVV